MGKGSVKCKPVEIGGRVSFAFYYVLVAASWAVVLCILWINIIRG